MTAPATLADRLVKLCGMLGSVHDGERAAAALKADQLLRDHGLRWSDIITVPQLLPPPDPKPPPPSPPARRSWCEPRFNNRHAADYIVSYWPEALTDWERRFCRQIAAQRRLSRKQWIVLKRLVSKASRFAEPGA